MIPKKYDYLLEPGQPRILEIAVAMYGTKEIAGAKNNPVILGWADEVGGWIGQWYEQDSIPWCGLFVGVCAKRAGFPFDQKLLAAKEWTRWGDKVEIAKRGDVLIFVRDGGGHVGFYVGEDEHAYHVLGGNQSDAVTITRIAKNRLAKDGIRRCRWKVFEPDTVVRTFLDAKGALSKNEA